MCTSIGFVISFSICVRKFDWILGGGGGEVQTMLDIRLSRGRDNIKNYGEEKNLKKYLVFPVSKLART